MKPRFVVSAPRVLQSALVPTALVVARVKVRNPEAPNRPTFANALRGKHPPALVLTYVFLDDEERSALFYLTRESGSLGCIGDLGPGEWTEVAPALLRTQDVDVETGFPVGADRLDLRALAAQRHRVSWLSGEGLWVLSNLYATLAVDALMAWRAAHPRRDDAIHAPSWRALTAVRKLAIATEKLADPGAGE